MAKAAYLNRVFQREISAGKLTVVGCLICRFQLKDNNSHTTSCPGENIAHFDPGLIFEL